MKRAPIRDAKAAAALLAELFPAAFGTAVPLARDMRDQVVAAIGTSAIRPCELVRALEVYTSTPEYLGACRPNAIRVGLDGAPAGIVTPGEAARAALTLADLMLAADRVERHPVKAAAPVIETEREQDARVLKGLLSLSRHPLAPKEPQQ